MSHSRREIGIARALLIAVILLSSASALAYTITYTYNKTSGELTGAKYSNIANITYGYDAGYNRMSAGRVGTAHH